MCPRCPKNLCEISALCHNIMEQQNSTQISNNRFSNNGESQVRTRHFAGTDNQFSEERWQSYLDACASGPVDGETGLANGICYDSQGFAFVCGQVEAATSTNHAHVQLHFSLVHPQTRSGLSTKLRQLGITGCHLEPIRARLADGSGVNPQANISYCTRADKRHPEHPDKVFEWGDKPLNVGKRGGRSDLDKLAQDLRDGKNFQHIARKHTKTYIKYPSGINSLVEFFRAPRNVQKPPEVFWFFGPTGTGKSRAVFDIVGDTAYWKSAAHKWWDGYYDQTDVVIDDYRPDFCTFTELLRILDRYTHQVEYKGGVRQLKAERIFITCPHNPRETWIHQQSERIDQLERRITTVQEFKTDPTVFETLALDNFVAFLKSKTPVVAESEDEESVEDRPPNDPSTNIVDEPDGESLGEEDSESEEEDEHGDL